MCIIRNLFLELYVFVYVQVVHCFSNFSPPPPEFHIILDKIVLLGDLNRINRNQRKTKQSVDWVWMQKLSGLSRSTGTLAALKSHHLQIEEFQNIIQQQKSVLFFLFKNVFILIFLALMCAIKQRNLTKNVIPAMICFKVHVL